MKKLFHINSFGAGLRLMLIAVAGLSILIACESSEKVLKSRDKNYKLKMATMWYEKKQYFKAIPVLEELMGELKGDTSIENIYFMYCMANYKQGDFMISAYHFKNFATTYSSSPHAEEAAYLHAASDEKQSPKYELDQTHTYKAIESFQNFINQYPENQKVAMANSEIQRLRKKLERKALANAELYYKTSNFRAAAVSFENLLTQYPDIDNVERILFMVVKSYNKFAENSIATKRTDRYHTVISAYKTFAYKYPQSKFVAEASGYEKQAHYLACESAFDHAYSVPPQEREKQFLLAIKECNTQLPSISDPKQIKKCNELIEKSYLGIIRNNFDMAEELSDTNVARRSVRKLDLLDKTVKSYYTFVDKYKGSKYFKDAEKLYALASDNIDKIKKDGQKQKD